MNLIEALKEIKAKSNNKDHINRFMVVRRKYIDENTKQVIIARICVKDDNISLSNIDITMDDLHCGDWEVLTAYKQDNPGICTNDSKLDI